MHEPTTILIVEDELIAAEYLKQVLQSNGYKVVDIVDTGEEAVAAALRHRPDIILMDIYLQDSMSGCEAALAISRTLSSHIVFLTAYAEEEMIDYAVASRAGGYLMKPYNNAEIVATLRLLQAKNAPCGAAAEPVPPQNAAAVALANGYVFDRSAGKLLFDGEEIDLSKKGNRLIEVLCSRPRISVSNEELMRYVWSEEVNLQRLRSLVFRVRKIIGEEMIVNYNGVGYLIATK